MIELRNISFSYGAAPVLADLSLRIGRGEYALLRGESGCGKSTLLRLLCRLEAPREGTLLLDGEPYDALPPRALRRRLALLQQLPVMMEGSIRDNILLSQRYAGADGKGMTDAELRDMLQRAKLADLDLDASADALSVGQKQRIALLRLLVMRPDALLLDEPTSALDAESAAIIMDWIREWNETRGTTVVLVSHGNIHALPEAVCRYRMDAGRVEEEGQ
ncbi:MAG: ATP-binding cassette domain-containing protein [Ignavibacteria bacterium]|nr:ATP-binding cassette domain-containing protein [Ignavibacteria bacterium]